MKKIIMLILSALILSGCSQNEKTNNTTYTETHPISSETTPEADTKSEAYEDAETETTQEANTDVEATEVIEVIETAEPEPQKAEERTSPEDVVAEKINDLIDTDASTFGCDFSNFFDKFDYKITGSNILDDTAEVYVDITCHDLSNIMAEVTEELLVLSIDSVFSGEDFDADAATNELMTEKLTELSYPIITKSVTAYLTYSEETWVFTDSLNYDFLSATMGGFMPPENFAEQSPESEPENEPETKPEAQAEPETTINPEPIPETIAEQKTDTLTTGQKNALRKAESYLNFTAFSYQGLINQLLFDKYSEEDAIFAADNCEADWNDQALKKAGSYLDFTAFSYSGLIGQLEFDKFTTEQATYAADNCGADWNDQAAKKAKSYLDFTAFSRDGLISQLEFDGFTHDQAVYGAEQNGY